VNARTLCVCVCVVRTGGVKANEKMIVNTYALALGERASERGRQ
jgi:hypothetical protein